MPVYDFSMKKDLDLNRFLHYRAVKAFTDLIL